MSARNWDTCPQCLARAKQDRKRKADHAADLYGKIAPADYLALVEQVNEPIQPDETMREDYEVSIDDDGKFYFRYSASCDVCDYSFSHGPIEIQTTIKADEE